MFFFVIYTEKEKRTLQEWQSFFFSSTYTRQTIKRWNLKRIDSSLMVVFVLHITMDNVCLSSFSFATKSMKNYIDSCYCCFSSSSKDMCYFLEPVDNLVHPLEVHSYHFQKHLEQNPLHKQKVLLILFEVQWICKQVIERHIFLSKCHLHER